MRFSRPLTILTALSIVALPAVAEEIAIEENASVLAVITHKGGFAAGQAHDHLIAAPVAGAKLVFDPAAPLAASFELDFSAEELTVDPWDLQQAWYPRLQELGILEEAFSELSEKDRRKIGKTMLSAGQLDAALHPRITARLEGVEKEMATHGGVAFPFAARLALEVHGRTVEKPAAARYEAADGVLKIEAVGTFQFTDFGIEPHSAFFGAVKNQDGFHVYLNLTAPLPAAAAEPDGKAETGISQP